ncbi:MAG TPA: protein phosphatase 2C domain-containing protein [Symbiobacteriaceae bacterium]|nr:protein phosphatase 2C domain-containing protein [Symbiobacteriaceae bacterium]
MTLEWSLLGEGAPERLLLAAVADGMGGHEGGEIASRLVARALGDSIATGLSRAPLEGLELGSDTLATLLERGVAAASARVAEAGEHGLVEMGTTLCAALVTASGACVANVGDSRAYLIDGGAQQITTDHSLVQRLVDQGAITPAEALDHPNRHEIYRMIGFGRQAQPDLFALPLQPGDVLLLCSDGLSNLVSPAELAGAFDGQPPLGPAVDSLIRLALDRGAPDNVTAVAVRLRSGEVGS